MRAVATMTAMSLKSMLPPMERESSSAACERSGGPGLGNFEGVAIDGCDIEDFAGLARSAARDLRVPERVAIFHARVARALVDPRLECRRLADVQPPHRARDGPPSVLMPPGDAEHEQVERSRGELGDD